jgi:probable addiction module antidote protein
MGTMELRNFNETLVRELQDPVVAAAYLEESLEESTSEFLIALRKYVQANGGMAACAKKAGVTREALYRMLSETGNPEFESLRSILLACGLKVRFAIDRDVQPAA